MKRTKHDEDAKALEAIYEAARAQLSETCVMNDDAKSRLIVIVLKVYYSAMEGGAASDLDSAVCEAVAAFVGIGPSD